LRSNTPILALAPMQDVTDLRFMRLIGGYGNADVYFTEYFRVLPESRLPCAKRVSKMRRRRPASRA
jgi:tRNA-dihydrouridine synthase